MNAYPTDAKNPSESAGQAKPFAAPSGNRAKSADVPVFNCIVYVLTTASGEVRARVANLPDLHCAAGSERAALSQLVPAFKQRVAELTRAGTPIPWIEPPLPTEPGEQRRFVPVHL
jgi:hypothetical protein